MNIEDLLERFRSRGAWDSEGAFSVDRSGAWTFSGLIRAGSIGIECNKICAYPIRMRSKSASCR